MKKILVLTDFSENSVNAYRYAVQLACQFKAELILLFSTNGAALSITNQLQYFQQLRSFSKRYACATRHRDNPHTTECLLSGDRWHQLLQTMVQVHQPDLIIGGSELLEAIEAEQDLLQLEQLGGCPLLWIPEKANYAPLKNIVFVTDFTDQEPAVIESVNHFADLFRAEVSRVHFYPGTQRSELAEIKKSGTELHRLLQPLSPPGYLLEEENMVEGLNDFAEQHPVDLFLIATRETHLARQYLRSGYQKTQSCQTFIPLLNLYQNKTKPCTGTCTYCNKKDKTPVTMPE